VRRDALVRRLNFPRASHKRKFSAVLLIEVITMKFSAVIYLCQRTVVVQE